MKGIKARLYDALTRWTAKASSRRLTGEGRMSGWVGPYNGTPGAWAGDAARQVMEFQGWVYVAVDFIASNMAACTPVAVKCVEMEEREDYEMKCKAFLRGRGKQPPARRFVQPYVIEKSTNAKPYQEDYEYLPSSDPLAKLLADPNEPMTGYQLWYLCEVFLDLTGSVYLYKHRDGSGRIESLWVVPTQWVNPIGLGVDTLVDFYEVNPRTSGSGIYGGGNRVDPSDMIRINKPSPMHPLAGYSATQAAAASIDTYKQITAVRYLGLQNGMTVGGVVELDDNAQFTSDDITRLESRLQGHYGGVFNAGRPLIIQHGKFTPSPSRELDYNASQVHERESILTAFGIDPSMVVSSESTYAASIDNRRRVRMNVIEPRLKLFAGALTERLARDEFGDDYRVIYPDNPQETHEEKIQTWTYLKDDTTTNERRQAFGLDPIDAPGADELAQDPMTMPADAWDGSGGLMQGDDGEDGPADELTQQAVDALLAGETPEGYATKGASGVFTDSAGRKYRLADGKRVPLGNADAGTKPDAASVKPHVEQVAAKLGISEDEAAAKIDEMRNAMADKPEMEKPEAEKPEGGKPSGESFSSATYEAVGNRFNIPASVVKDVLETHPDELAKRSEYTAPSSRRDNPVGPTLDYPKNELNSARIDDSRHNSGDTEDAYVDYLREFDPKDLKTSEHEDGMKKSGSVAAYVEWLKAGHEPPPITVFDSSNGNGELISTNRRRLLAAQMAGVKTITAWYGPLNPETKDPLKYGDIMRAAKEHESSKV